MIDDLPDENRLRELLHYNCKTGIFHWNVSIGTAKKGSVAGFVRKYPNGDRYINIEISSKSYQAGRLAWLYYYGKCPEYSIDHINGDSTDNRIKNLRDVRHIENCRNQKLRSTNKSGVMGVSWHKSNNRWQAAIKDHGKTIYLGSFTKLSDAANCRKNAERALNYHPNHGKIQHG